MADRVRSDTEVRLANADYGHVEDDTEYLDYPNSLPAVGKPLTNADMTAFLLRDIALSLRRLVIIADAIRRGTKQ